MSAGVLNPPLSAHVVSVCQVTPLELDFILSFIISLYYLYNNKVKLFFFLFHSRTDFLCVGCDYSIQNWFPKFNFCSDFYSYRSLALFSQSFLDHISSS